MIKMGCRVVLFDRVAGGVDEGGKPAWIVLTIIIVMGFYSGLILITNEFFNAKSINKDIRLGQQMANPAV